MHETTKEFTDAEIHQLGKRCAEMGLKRERINSFSITDGTSKDLFKQLEDALDCDIDEALSGDYSKALEVLAALKANNARLADKLEASEKELRLCRVAYHTARRLGISEEKALYLVLKDALGAGEG